VERGTVRVKYVAQEHAAMSLAKASFVVKGTPDKATAPPSQ